MDFGKTFCWVESNKIILRYYSSSKLLWFVLIAKVFVYTDCFGCDVNAAHVLPLPSPPTLWWVKRVKTQELLQLAVVRKEIQLVALVTFRLF